MPRFTRGKNATCEVRFFPLAARAMSSGHIRPCRNLFRKLDVSSRVEVARVVERADRGEG